MNTTYTAQQIQTLIAAGINLNEFFAAGSSVETAPAKPAKVDGRNHAARKHNHEARIERRVTTVRGGLTKAERRTLAAILREELGREFTAEEWEANLVAYKAGEFTVEGF